MSHLPLDVESECRPHFPALKTGYIFADNAGGSQCLKDVVDRVSDYLLNTNVQLGADYSVSKVSTTRVMIDAPKSAATLINATSPEEISFGSSSTMLVENLARSIEADVLSDEELVVSFADHEANVGPWVRLGSRKGANVIPWLARTSATDSNNPFQVSLHLEDLKTLITAKTRLVTFTACSNILGEITPVKEFIQAIRKEAETKGARKVEICVDCVAYAPHRQIDVQDWDVDYCFFSYYKVYGPHTSILYSKKASLDGSVSSLAHYFLKSYKLQPGGPGYELTYATTGVLSYFLGLAPTANSETAKDTLHHAFERIARYEGELMKPLLEYLLSKKERGVRIVGPESADPAIRAPTVSFVIVSEDGKTKRVKSRDVVAQFDALGDMGIRFGHFYSHRLLSQLDDDPDDGVIRISLVHYNTLEEVTKLVATLERIL